MFGSKLPVHLIQGHFFISRKEGPNVLRLARMVEQSHPDLAKLPRIPLRHGLGKLVPGGVVRSTPGRDPRHVDIIRHPDLDLAEILAPLPEKVHLFLAPDACPLLRWAVIRQQLPRLHALLRVPHLSPDWTWRQTPSRRDPGARDRPLEKEVVGSTRYLVEDLRT